MSDNDLGEKIEAEIQRFFDKDPTEIHFLLQTEQEKVTSNLRTHLNRVGYSDPLIERAGIDLDKRVFAEYLRRSKR